MKVLILSVFLIVTSMGYVFAEPITAQVSSHEKIHFVDEQIMIMADISNNQDVQQNFAYITQVKNDKDVVISLSWLTKSRKTSTGTMMLARNPVTIISATKV